MRKPKKIFVVSLIIIVVIAIVAVSLMFFYASTCLLYTSVRAIRPVLDKRADTGRRIPPAAALNLDILFPLLL